MIRVNMFVDMDIELVKESSKKDEAEMAQESSSKRAGEELEQEHRTIVRRLHFDLLRDAYLRYWIYLNSRSTLVKDSYLFGTCHCKEVEDKIREKRLQDVSIVQDLYQRVFLRTCLGLPPTRQVEFQIDSGTWLYKTQFILGSSGLVCQEKDDLFRKANVVADALSRKEQEPPLRVRALVMSISLDLPKQILNAQTEARRPKNIKNERRWREC
ncbi:hypothetical protein Tco_0502793 [Tanacetum coccineum]